MRRSLFRMISPTSLAAFSASITHGGIAGVPTTRAKPAAARAAPSQAGPHSSAPAQPPLAPPGQKLPRGSLLNLTA
ncbi:MAG: hypothetical protein NT133_12350 [Alphaproteobacteria bacterium]|nr:hypothetical protein [Alphaproteobacteria bacterium]